MNREQLIKQLDADRNGRVNFEDVITLVEGNDRKLFGLGFVVGALCSFLIFILRAVLS